MTQTVEGLIKVLKQTIEELEKCDPNAEVVHCLCPDGGYSGDIEDTFTNSTVDTDEDLIVVNLYY